MAAAENRAPADGAAVSESNAAAGRTMVVMPGSITKIAVKFPVQDEGRVWRRGSRAGIQQNEQAGQYADTEQLPGMFHIIPSFPLIMKIPSRKWKTCQVKHNQTANPLSRVCVKLDETRNRRLPSANKR